MKRNYLLTESLERDDKKQQQIAKGCDKKDPSNPCKHCKMDVKWNEDDDNKEDKPEGKFIARHLIYLLCMK